jgi:hypothetical protein
MKKADLSQPQLGLLSSIKASFQQDILDQKHDCNGERIREERDVESANCKFQIIDRLLLGRKKLINTATGTTIVQLSDAETDVLKKGGQRLWIYIRKSLDHHMDNIKVKRKQEQKNQRASMIQGTRDLILVDTERDINPDIEKLRCVVMKSHRL